MNMLKLDSASTYAFLRENSVLSNARSLVMPPTATFGTFNTMP